MLLIKKERNLFHYNPLQRGVTKVRQLIVQDAVTNSKSAAELNGTRSLFEDFTNTAKVNSGLPSTSRVFSRVFSH